MIFNSNVNQFQNQDQYQFEPQSEERQKSEQDSTLFPPFNPQQSHEHVQVESSHHSLLPPPPPLARLAHHSESELDPIAAPPSSFGSPSSERDFNSPFIHSATSCSPLSYLEDYCFLSPHAHAHAHAQPQQRDFNLFSPTMSPIIQSIQDDDGFDQVEGIDAEWLKNAPLFPDSGRDDKGNKGSSDDSSSSSSSLHPQPQHQHRQQLQSTSNSSTSPVHLVQTVSPFQVDLHSFQEDQQMAQFSPYQPASLQSGGGAVPLHLNSSPSPPAPSHRGSTASSRSSVSMDGVLDEQDWNQGVSGEGSSRSELVHQVSQLASKFSGSQDPESADKLLRALNEKGIVLEEGIISQVLADQSESQGGLKVNQGSTPSTHSPSPSGSRPARSTFNKVSRFQTQYDSQATDREASSPSTRESSIDLNSDAGSPPPEDHDDLYRPSTSARGTKHRSSSHASSSKSKKKLVGKPFVHEKGVPTCPTCSTTFSRWFNLKTHMETHIPPEQRRKPFICPNMRCQKSFSRKSDMTRHTKIHERR